MVAWCVWLLRAKGTSLDEVFVVVVDGLAQHRRRPEETQKKTKKTQRENKEIGEGRAHIVKRERVWGENTQREDGEDGESERERERREGKREKRERAVVFGLQASISS